MIGSGFRSLAEKEPVEYELAKDDNERAKAINVTGPNGAPVKGAPKPRPRYYGRKGADGEAPAAAGNGQPAAPRERKPREPKVCTTNIACSSRIATPPNECYILALICTCLPFLCVCSFQAAAAAAPAAAAAAPAAAQ